MRINARGDRRLESDCMVNLFLDQDDEVLNTLQAARKILDDLEKPAPFSDDIAQVVKDVVVVILVGDETLEIRIGAQIVKAATLPLDKSRAGAGGLASEPGVLPVQGEEQHPTRSSDAAELLQPLELVLLLQVREDGDPVNEVEALRGERERRVEIGRLE